MAAWLRFNYVKQPEAIISNDDSWKINYFTILSVQQSKLNGSKNLAHFLIILFYCWIMLSKRALIINVCVFFWHFIPKLYLPCSIELPASQSAHVIINSKYSHTCNIIFYKWSLIEIFRTEWNVKNSFLFLFTCQYMFGQNGQ